MACDVDFTMIQGDTRRIRYVCYDENNSPIDLTNANDIEWGMIRYGSFNSSPIITKSLGSGIIIENTNEAIVTMNPSDTEGIDGKFEHTFKVTDFSNDVFSENGLIIINISSL